MAPQKGCPNFTYGSQQLPSLLLFVCLLVYFWYFLKTSGVYIAAIGFEKCWGGFGIVMYTVDFIQTTKQRPIDSIDTETLPYNLPTVFMLGSFPL